jgi:eukaryotic-like serine/threonine-protein kinase
MRLAWNEMTQLEAGETLDHYHLDEVAARSGMATVFRATDQRTGKQVAIKVPHPEVESDPALFDRFRREEDIGQRLDHPGVMKVFAEEDRSQLYMVLEWADGKLLRQRLQQEKRLPLDQVVNIILQICDVLEYVHAHQVVHRDLKPENIMIDDQGRIKLIDFGIAASAGARRLTFANFSKTMGTPDYISPEQVKGKRGDVRSDIYALGVMLYEMSTGSMPFSGPNAFAVMNSRLLNNPVPPRELNPEITPQLQEIIYRALEREPKNRYASIRELAWDLRHQETVGVADRRELHDWKKQRVASSRKVWLYVALAILPVAIFVLMLLLARR